MNQLGNLAQLSRMSLENLSMDNIKAQVHSLQNKLSSLRPPQEFFNVKNISKPANFSDLQSRVSYNLGYYSSNYALIVGCLSIYTLLTNLLLLFVIVFVFAGFLGINKLGGQGLVTPFGSFNTTQLYTGLLCISVPLGFLASPISTLLWLIGASCMSVFSHASFMEKPIETIFEEETV
ncbi:similar to Saccharomyces cerevisiae YNL044W YIP3 Protein localized to COPII vesicles, proposed to be involved in ER to Golgi transport [Maudiozyma saulgeensis]|uniref:PRA1 family protein n=1 Tax=Maudiozyma saulgeensis TaxID=1789683 RepID=A0A1X7R9B6_9SACH|nr:similar to Saccharomyces cerevisiae YNL044W YIP3 Protein localized to COPII vesicles, proposed to be involved in ER to Golgi transport [Kazachstania saulgeensis]